jgi:dTDP-4-amino-4,6-dideoxygalactose transaminase
VLSPVSPRALVAGLWDGYSSNGRSERRAAALLQARFGAHETLLTDSGTSALVLAIRALVRKGGTIALPAYGCIDLTAVALRAGVRVRLYDLDPATLSPSLESLEATIARGVDAIIVAHLYGYPADVSAVQQMAAARGIPVIEDAAQGAGGSLHGALLGSLGDVAVLSFGRGKGTTGGSGGALLVRDAAMSHALERVRDRTPASRANGREVAALAAQWLLARPSLYRVPASIPALKLGEMVYRPAGEPRAISAIAAAILPSAFRLDADEVRIRAEHASTLLTQVASAKCLRAVVPVAEGRSGYLRLAVLDSVGGLSARPGLGVVRGYPQTLAQHAELQPILASGERAGRGAELLRDRLLTLPTHSRVGRSDLERLRRWIQMANARSPT